ncbi:MAG: hypothetical protein IPO37_13395 [Saprospiraceae bacterium]|nr:hypothetical protein [Saprospiraceae bacterium]
MIKFELEKEYLFQDIDKKQYISYCNVFKISFIKFSFEKEYNSFKISWNYKHLFDFISIIKRHELTIENINKLEKLGITL